MFFIRVIVFLVYPVSFASVVDVLFIQMSFLKNIPKIFIFDRGYRSIEFFHYLVKKEEKFVFRIRSNDYKKEKLKLITNDQWINIEVTKNRLNQMKDKKLKSTLLAVGGTVQNSTGGVYFIVYDVSHCPSYSV